MKENSEKRIGSSQSSPKKLIKNDALLLIAAFVFGIVLGMAIEGVIKTRTFESFLPPLATLIASFLGATYAFRLNSQKDFQKTQEANLAAGNQAIFTMARQVNKLTLLQRQIIDPHRKNPARALEMPPSEGLQSERISIDIAALNFLLKERFADLLGEIAIAEAKYSTAIDAIAIRSRIHITEVQPKLEKIVIPGGGLPIHIVRGALGERLFITLHTNTEQAIAAVDDSRTYLEEVAKKLQATLKSLFPGEPLVSFSVPDSVTPPPPAQP